jgi:hypothetical protein
MGKFLYVFRGGIAETPGFSPSEMQAHLKKWYEWSGVLQKAGHRTGGQALESRGKTIRGPERAVTDGPYAESKDLVTGSMILEASSLDEAVALARDCPVFELGGSVEVRPIHEPSA